MITSRLYLSTLALLAGASAALYFVRLLGLGIELVAGVLACAFVATVLPRAIEELSRREPSRELTATSAMGVVTGVAEAWHRLGEGATYATVRGTARHVEGGLQVHDLSGVAFVATGSVHAMQQRGERFSRGGTIADGDVVVVTGPAWRRLVADGPEQYRGRALAIELGDRGEDRVLVIRTTTRTSPVASAAAVPT